MKYNKILYSCIFSLILVGSIASYAAQLYQLVVVSPALLAQLVQIVSGSVIACNENKNIAKIPSGLLSEKDINIEAIPFNRFVDMYLKQKGMTDQERALVHECMQLKSTDSPDLLVRALEGLNLDRAGYAGGFKDQRAFNSKSPSAFVQSDGKVIFNWSSDKSENNQNYKVQRADDADISIDGIPLAQEAGTQQAQNTSGSVCIQVRTGNPAVSEYLQCYYDKAVKSAVLNSLFKDRAQLRNFIARFKDRYSLLKKATKLSDNVETIQNQMELLLERPWICKEFQEYIDHPFEDIIHCFIDKDGKFIGITSENDSKYAKSSLDNLKAFINELQKLEHTWFDHGKKVSYDTLLKIDPNGLSWWNSWKKDFWTLLGSYKSQEALIQRFLENEWNQSFIICVQSINAKNFDLANTYLELLSDNRFGCSSQKKMIEPLLKYFKKEFNEYNDSYGIPRSFIRDPVVGKYHQALNQLPLNHPKREKYIQAAQVELGIRDAIYQRMLKSLLVPEKNVPELVKSCLYELVDHWDNPDALIEALSTLSCDSSDMTSKAIYPYLRNQHGVLNLYEYDKSYFKKFSMPDAIHYDENHAARLLLDKIVRVKAVVPEVKVYGAQALRYIKASLEVPALKNEYQFLAQKIYDAMMYRDSDKTVLSLPDYSHYYSIFTAQEYHEKIVRLVAEGVNKISTATEYERESIIAGLQGAEWASQVLDASIESYDFTHMDDLIREEVESLIRYEAGVEKISACNQENASTTVSPGGPKKPDDKEKKKYKFDHEKLFKKYKGHIFSYDHIQGGILELGPSKQDILETLKNIVMDVNEQGLLKDFSNQIEMSINGHEVTLKVFAQNGEITSVNLFMGHSQRELGNVIFYVLPK